VTDLFFKRKKTHNNGGGGGKGKGKVATTTPTNLQKGVTKLAGLLIGEPRAGGEPGLERDLGEKRGGAI